MLSMIVMTMKGLLLIAGAVYGFAFLLGKEDAVWVKRAPLAIFLLMFIIGMWGHIYWTAYVALLLALPLAAKNRPEAAALYCVLIVSLPALGHPIQIGSLYLVSADKYLFAALGLALAFIVKRHNETGTFQHHYFGIPITILLVLELTHQRDPSITAMLRQFIPIVAAILLPYLFTSRSLRNSEDVRRFLLAFTLSGFVMAVVATVEARLHWLIYQQINGSLQIQLGVNLYAKVRAGLLRAPASFPESTTLATFLVLSIMAALASRSSFASRIKWWAVLGVLGLGLISANSRGAFVALAVGLIAWDFYHRRYGMLVLKVALAAGVYGSALLAAQFSGFFAAMVGQDSGTASTTDYRTQLLHRGMEEIRKHPLFGQNLNTALDNLQDLRQGEGIIDIVNGYINYGLTLGYPGMIGLGLAFASLSLAMLAIRTKLEKNKILIDAAACVFAAAALSAVNCFFTGFGGGISTSFYQMCALGSAIWAMRSAASAAKGVSGAVARKGISSAVAPPTRTGIAALIVADRVRAKAASVQEG